MPGKAAALSRLSVDTATRKELHRLRHFPAGKSLGCSSLLVGLVGAGGMFLLSCTVINRETSSAMTHLMSCWHLCRRRKLRAAERRAHRHQQPGHLHAHQPDSLRGAVSHLAVPLTTVHVAAVMPSLRTVPLKMSSMACTSMFYAQSGHYWRACASPLWTLLTTLLSCWLQQRMCANRFQILNQMLAPLAMALVIQLQHQIRTNRGSKPSKQEQNVPRQERTVQPKLRSWSTQWAIWSLKQSLCMCR